MKAAPRFLSAGLQPLAFSLFTFLFSLAFHARGQAIDSLVSAPDLWQSASGDFVEKHAGLGFYWLSDAHDRAETHSKGLTLFSKPIYQVDADFQAGKLASLTISIYNRGDAGNLDSDQWNKLLLACDQGLMTLTNVMPEIQGKEESDVVKAYAVSWQTPVSKFLLDYSATQGVQTRNIAFRPEFIRLKVTPVEKSKAMLAAALASASPGAAFNGPSHVKKDSSGDIRLDPIPVLEQGHRTNTGVATVERALLYFGAHVDEPELEEISNTSTTLGTSNDAMFGALKKLSDKLRLKVESIVTMDARQMLDTINEYNRRARRGNRAPEISVQGNQLDMQRIYATMQPAILKEARTHNKADVDRFQKDVQDRIDRGIPLLWTVTLGIVPEPEAPPGITCVMRLIIGYNTGTSEILYTDSWGSGHELKRMPAADAWTITAALNTIEPLDSSSAN